MRIRFILVCLLLAAMVPMPALASDADFTVIFVPDPQYLPVSTHFAAADNADPTTRPYNQMMQWIVDHKAALNLKGVISAGDILDSYVEPQISNTISAWGVLRAAGIPEHHTRGNHDGGNRGDIGMFIGTGYFGPTTMAAVYGSGMDMGAGDRAYWGGVYPDPEYAPSIQNSYTRLKIGTRKYLLISVEPFPRVAVMNWAKSISDAYPDHETWFITHAYLKAASSDEIDRAYIYGPQAYGLAPPPASLSADEMWGTTPVAGFTTPLKTWKNLTLILNGHTGNFDVHTYTSDSPRHQTVQAVNVDLQNYDWDSDAPNTAHVMLIKVRPSSGVMDFYAQSTQSGNYHYQDCNLCSSYWLPTPNLRLSQTLQSFFGGLFPLPSSFKR